MNDADIPDQDEVLGSEPSNKAAKSQRPRSRVRRGFGGTVFATGAFLLLIAGIALGASRHHSKQQLVMATADQTRQFTPTVGVAAVEASPAVTSVTLPGTTVRQEKPDASSGRNSRLGKGNEPPHRESSLGLMEATT
jgi:hypothetical protein